MTVLAFDCTTHSCSVALTAADDRLLAHRSALMDRGHAEALMPMVEEVLADAGMAWRDVDLLGVTVGPGTFTGVRIGLAAARGMALAGTMATAGVLTTEAVAHAVPAAERAGRTVLAVVDGKRADLFVQAFDETLVPLGAPLAAMPDALAALFPGPLLLAGNGAPRAAEALPGARLSASTASAPDAAVVAALATLLCRQGRALPLRPVYLRPADVTLPTRAS